MIPFDTKSAPSMFPELEQALSLERFARYVSWAGGHRDEALRLYTLNTQISEALYVPLQALELSLRNRVHSVMTDTYGDRWFENEQILCAPHQKAQVAEAINGLIKDEKEPLPGRIVAALTFSFWTAMLSPDYENIYRSTLHAIAITSDGKRLARKQFARPLTQIRLLRNRIAHHEPILHWDIPRHHKSIIEITSWLSPAVAHWCAKIDRFGELYPVDGYHLHAAGAAASSPLE